MKSVYYLVLFAVLLSSCSSTPSGDVVQTAKVQTEMARPTKTFVFNLTAIPTRLPHTPLPLGAIDLESILLMPGDLPSNYVLSVFYKKLPDIRIFNKDHNFPSPDAVTSMDIDNTKVTDSFGDYERSRVIIMLYNDLAQRDFAYEKLSDPDNFVDTAVISPADIGEKAATIKVPIGDEYVIFNRCNALVFMHTTDDTANYAQRLDERLTPLVCG